MKFLLTGMNGTVAPAIAAELEAQGHAVVAWDRSVLPYSTLAEVQAAFDQVKPDAVMHFAMGSTDWAAWMASECQRRGLRFLHTSSVSVYGASQVGPFTIEDAPHPDDDYGRYKLEGEQKVLASNPSAAVFRIGWQIGDAPGNNNMIDYFDRQMREKGVIQASTLWIPGASRLVDTAECLVRHFLEGYQGIYHVDGNPGFNLYELALESKQRLGTDWVIEPIEGMVRNHRMTDPRITIRALG